MGSSAMKKQDIIVHWGNNYKNVEDYQTNDCEIKDWKHFITLTNQADSISNTKTFIYKGSISSVVVDLLKWDNDYNSYSSYQFSKEIEMLFRKSDTVLSNEIGPVKSTKINAFDYILETFRQGYPIVDPVNLHYFGNGKLTPHPGYTRLLFGKLYTKNIDCIIYDYTNGKFKQDFKNINIVTPGETHIDINKRRYMFSHTGLTKRPRELHKMSGKENGVKYREVKSKDPIPKELGDPRLYNPPRIYKKENDVVTVDGKEVLRNNNGFWELVL